MAGKFALCLLLKEILYNGSTFYVYAYWTKMNELKKKQYRINSYLVGISLSKCSFSH